MWTQLPGEKRIALDDENLQYTGRIDFADPQNPVFLFTASFVRFRMTGHHLRVVLPNGLYEVKHGAYRQIWMAQTTSATARTT